MPLAVQALLPFALLTGAAAAVHLPGLRRHGGVYAALATAAAGGVAATLLLRLAPAERVDIPYLKTFPWMDVAVRVDALSSAFALTLLATACLLLLARLAGADDRRRPWSAWLLTTAAALGVVFAANLVLIYLFLQLLTLAWSGALDEAAPRGRGLRIAVQVADAGLLVAAGLATASVGTSALSGLPSDAFGEATFLIALLPVAVRVGALALLDERPRTPVLFEPAIAQAAVAGYLLLRLISVTGGRPPGRPLQVLMFAAGVTAAAVLCLIAWRAASDATARLRLVAAQAAIAVALCALGTPLGAVAGVWAWLGAIALTGLAGIRQEPGSSAAALTAAALMLLPPGFLFLGLWLGTQTLIDQQLAIAAVPLWLVAAGSALAALRRARRPQWGRPAVAAAGGALLIAIGAVPALVLSWMTVPAARIVRAIPGGTLNAGPLGITAGATPLPALAIALVGSAGLAVWVRAGLAPPTGTSPAPPPAATGPVHPAAALDLAALRGVPWSRIAWLAYAVIVAVAIAQR